MRESFHCRRCGTGVISSGGRRPFAVAGAVPRYAPDLPFRLEHLALEVKVEPRQKWLEGTATQRVRVVAPGRRRVTLDQIGLEILEARVGGKTAPHAVEGHQLHVELPQAYAAGEIFELSVRYRVSGTRRGLFFTGPDADYPQKPYQVWSQGQDEDNRYWIPTFDYPNQKATWEIAATVPAGFTAVSNGAQLSKGPPPGGEKGWTRFHYKLGSPHVTYLISLVVAEFAEWQDQGPRGLPVQYYVAPGREEDGKRAFGHTPRMIEAYEKATGVPYPYEKYSQVAVQDFIFGGMENSSATTQTDRTLHDARAHLDFSSDPLVSHELAHQWFGDLITCRDWSHGWLNEGFATFMERVWIEADPSPNGGEEEAKYYSYMDLKEYQEEDSGKYRRPIVCNTFVEPIDLFDTHLYQKGGLVLNLLRAQLGPELFWKAIQLYLTRHRGGSVETLDLVRAIEDATGRNLRRFFDEWIFGAGYPELELTYAWHEDRKLAELVIEQKQTDGKPSVTCDGATTHLFHLTARVDFLLDGRRVTHTVDLGEARERIFLPVESKPLAVLFDPGNTIPKSIKFPRPKELLLYQLTQACDCMARIEAVRELAKLPEALSPEILTALGGAARKDAFWGVQAEAAGALAELKSDAARDALIDALAVSHPKARRAVVKALGSYRDAKAAAALRKLAEKDASYFVEAEATVALARTRGRAEAEAPAVEKLIDAQLAKNSFNDVIRATALRALGELPGIERGERESALKKLEQWTARGRSDDTRAAAVSTLARIAGSATPTIRARALETLAGVAEDENFRLRMTLAAALGESGLPDAIPILEKLRQLDLDGRVKRAALTSREALLTAGSTPESVSALRARLEKLEEEQRKLRDQVIEARAFSRP